MIDPLFGEGSRLMPQLARDYSRQRQMGIGDLLLENRIVFLGGQIHDVLGSALGKVQDDKDAACRVNLGKVALNRLTTDRRKGPTRDKQANSSKSDGGRSSDFHLRELLQ